MVTSDEDEETVEIPLSLAQELADQHKDVAARAYSKSYQTVGDKHHSWARKLHEQDPRQWSEVGNKYNDA